MQAITHTHHARLLTLYTYNAPMSTQPVFLLCNFYLLPWNGCRGA